MVSFKDATLEVARVEELTTFLSTKSQHVSFLTSDAGEAAAKNNMAFFCLWCTVELAAAIELGKPVVIQGGVVVRDEDLGGGGGGGGGDGERFLDTRGMKEMLDNLTHMVDCEKAECAVRADYVREMGRIEKMEGGVDKINRTAASWT
jgi:hypothetical protein